MRKKHGHAAVGVSRGVVLYDAHGDPIDLNKMKQNSKRKFAGSFSFLQAMAETREDPDRRAAKPFRNHIWVYAAAQAKAINLSQAPYLVWSETPEQTEIRRTRAVKRGVVKNPAHWVPPCGRNRSIVQRILRSRYRMSGGKVRTLEEFPEHWLWSILQRPNSLITTSTVRIQAIIIDLTVRGESAWLPITADGSPWLPGFEFEQIVRLQQDNLREHVVNNQLLWWDYTPSSSDAGSGLQGTRPIRLMPNEVVLYRRFNPDYPLRGLSPISAAAFAIMQDLRAEQYNEALLKNNAEPGGVLMTDGVLQGDEKKEMAQAWKQRFGGQNRRNIAVLEGGVKYQQTSLTQVDMQLLDMLKWDRDAILAVCGPVPKSVLSITDDLNYSIQLSQDRNFWNKALIPDARIIEDVDDQTLLFGEPDTVTAGFDFSVIEALQEDLSAKTDTVVKMVNEARIPPRLAWERVGVDMPEYEGDEEILVSPLQVPIDVLLTSARDPDEPDGDQPPGDPDGDGDAENPTLPPGDTPPDEPADDDAESRATKKVRLVEVSKLLCAPPAITPFLSRRGMSPVTFSGQARLRKGTVARGYANLFNAVEPVVRRLWKSHVLNYRRAQLEAWFDYLKREDIKSAVEKARTITLADVEKVLIGLAEQDKRLSTSMRSAYEQMADTVTDFTKDELGGIFIFDLDDEKAIRFLNSRQTKVKDRNKTLRKRLSDSLSEGISAGESIDDLRKRINGVFNRAISPGRATGIARTEAAQTMSGIRELIFEAEGVSKHDWTTAGDEHVRKDHETLGAVGPQPIGHNYMTDLGKPGTLRYPSDPNGPRDQIINCRCVAVAAG